MKVNKIVWLIGALALAQSAWATTYYVSARNGSDNNSGLSWEAAFKTIQAAVDKDEKGSTIIVDDGVYGAVKVVGWNYGTEYDRSITIKSKNGAAKTIIDGGQTTCCFAVSYYRCYNTKLIGFTLQNGVPKYSEYGTSLNAGGSIGGTLENCVIKNCIGPAFGGVLNGSRLVNCLIYDNESDRNGFIINGRSITNCTIVDNKGESQLIASDSSERNMLELTNCIIANNEASYLIYSKDDFKEFSNCNIWGNTYSVSEFNRFPTDGTNNIRLNPLFVNANAGDYRLSTNSPCIDKGLNDKISGYATDLAGSERRIGASVDIGAYEYVGHTLTTDIPVMYSWLIEHYSKIADVPEAYEAKAKETAANGHKVWECYVAGEDPTDKDSKFAADITVGEDGKPVVSWNPDLGSERVYKILGSTDLKTWVEVPEGKEANYNFFKVSVEMP